MLVGIERRELVAVLVALVIVLLVIVLLVIMALVMPVSSCSLLICAD